MSAIAVLDLHSLGQPLPMPEGPPDPLLERWFHMAGRLMVRVAHESTMRNGTFIGFGEYRTQRWGCFFPSDTVPVGELPVTSDHLRFGHLASWLGVTLAPEGHNPSGPLVLIDHKYPRFGKPTTTLGYGNRLHPTKITVTHATPMLPIDNES